MDTLKKVDVPLIEIKIHASNLKNQCKKYKWTKNYQNIKQWMHQKQHFNKISNA